MDGWLNKHGEGGHLPFVEPLLKKESTTNNVAADWPFYKCMRRMHFDNYSCTGLQGI